jgi:hypothetical protein
VVGERVTERVAIDGLGYVRCLECGTPIFQVDGWHLVIIDKHHGERHTNYIDVRELAELVERRESERSA